MGARKREWSKRFGKAYVYDKSRMNHHHSWCTLVRFEMLGQWLRDNPSASVEEARVQHEDQWNIVTKKKAYAKNIKDVVDGSQCSVRPEKRKAMDS